MAPFFRYTPTGAKWPRKGVPLHPKSKKTKAGNRKKKLQIHSFFFLLPIFESGRAAKMKEKRIKIEKLRFRQSELKAIKSRVPEGETRSGWIRRILLQEDPIKKRKRLVAPEVDPELMRQLGRMGGNLNQIAKALNRANKVGGHVQLVEILAILRMMEQHLVEIRTLNQRRKDVC